jgi:ribosomal protein S18 acetylase RimI-like enzyme
MSEYGDVSGEDQFGWFTGEYDATTPGDAWGDGIEYPRLDEGYDPAFLRSDDSLAESDNQTPVSDSQFEALVRGNFEVAQAIPADAQEIGALRARNWKEQYARLDGVTEDWMNSEVDRITNEESNSGRAHWIEQAARPDANNYWLVARAEDGTLAGFLEARRHDDGTQELRSLHLAPGQRGMGIGQTLMDVAHREWFDPNAETFLDVAKVNEAGQRFYSRSPNNYELTGHTFFYGPVAMLQMKRGASR